MVENKKDVIHDIVHETARDEARHGNLEGLFSEIYEREVLPVDGELSDVERYRIEGKIFAAIRSDVDTSHYPRRRKKRVLLVLIAAIIAAFGLTAGAAAQNDWDIALMNLMGINDADSIQLEGGVVEISTNASCVGTDYKNNPAGEQKTINVTKVTSIGDKNNAYIRIDTDYELPPDFNEKTDYILPKDTDITIRKKKAGDINSSGWASVFTSAYDDGKLSFVFNITGCENLNKSYVEIDFEDLYLHHDMEYWDDADPEELIFAGSLHLEWEYSYQANAKSMRMLKVVDAGGVQVVIDKITITPLGIHVHGYSTKGVDGTIIMDLLHVDAITYKDGTRIVPEDFSQGGVRNSHELNLHINIEQIGHGLDVDNIASITVCGEVIEVR